MCLIDSSAVVVGAGALPQPCAKEYGFTLTEVLVAVALAGLLLAMAAPNFASLALRWQIRSAAQALQDSLYFARSEAIRRSAQVRLVANDGDWAKGWQVQATEQGKPKTLQQHARLGTRLRMTHEYDSDELTIDLWGMVSSATSGNFLLSPSNPTDVNVGAIRICIIGGRIYQMKNAGDCPT